MWDKGKGKGWVFLGVFMFLSHLDAKSLTDAIFFTAETYRDIGKMHAEQVCLCLCVCVYFL